MTSRLPIAVTDKILELTLETNHFAYFVIDERAVLVQKGGELLSMGVPDWQIGLPIDDKALFITGMIPMSHDYEYIPAYQLGDFSILDLHLFREGDLCWTILVDKSTEKKWESIARQTANELRLLQQKVERDKNKIRGSERHTRFDFFESLNMMAMLLNDDGSFELLEPVSSGFDSIYPEAQEFIHSMNPQDKFPFVENFLIDAHEVWKDKTNSKRLRSGPWMEVTSTEEEVALEAIALNWHGESLLFIEILNDNYHLNKIFLQLGREEVLMKNLLQVEVRKQTQEIRAREEEIALRLVCAADTRDDGETGSHIRRLGLYSELMAVNLGWSGADADMIRIAAPMHDIGKIGIPDKILRKPSALTESEFEIMKLHPEIGGRILSNSESSLVQMAQDISMTHHEKWDGSGYPRGLKGEDIPISGRIVAIVDVFDALIHKRVYKEEIAFDIAIEMMLKERGGHFDPELLDLFISLKNDMSHIAFDFSNPIGDDPFPGETYRTPE